MRSLLFLFKPSTSKLCYPCKPRPKDQRTHAKNLQTPQVNHIRLFYYIDTHSRIVWCHFCAGNCVIVASWRYECVRFIFLGSGLIDTVRSDFWGLLATLIGIRSLDIFFFAPAFRSRRRLFRSSAFYGSHLVGVRCVTCLPRGKKFTTTFGHSPL